MTNLNVKTNRQYRDRLFRLLFGRIEMKANIVSLYNALECTNYTVETELEITTLEDAIYIKMKNDVSLLIDSNLALWEQQSSYNPNMPLRGLMYFGNLYDSYIDKNSLNIYGESLVKIPTPQYVVFYNGDKDIEAVRKLRLSDSFINPDSSCDFEWTATMYNLNKGKNEDLLSKCKPLADYMTLVNYIKENQAKGLPVEEAIDNAVVRCISENVMADFLKNHRAEVIDVCITEYNEKTFVEGIREEGRAEGLVTGRENEIYLSVQDGDYGISRGAEKLGITESEFIKKMEAAGYKAPSLII